MFSLRVFQDRSTGDGMKAESVKIFDTTLRDCE
jgi:hypothetical protein